MERGPLGFTLGFGPAVTHDARQDGDEPRALARNYTFDQPTPDSMRSLALCDFVSHTSFVLAALRALHLAPLLPPSWLATIPGIGAEWSAAGGGRGRRCRRGCG